MRMVGVVLALSGVLSGCGVKRADALQTALTRSEEALLTCEADRRALGSELEACVESRADAETGRDAAEAKGVSLQQALDEERAARARLVADRGNLRQEVEQMTQALDALEAQRQRAEARAAAYRELVARFQTLIDAGTLEVRIIDGRMVVVLRNDVLFPSGSAALSAAGRVTLSQVAEVLGPMRDRRFQVEGHTDDQPIATPRHPNNWYLAADRAIHVVEHLIGAGVSEDALSAAAFGDTRPVAANTSPDGRAANRRIEIVVVPDLSELPGFEDVPAP